LERHAGTGNESWRIIQGAAEPDAWRRGRAICLDSCTSAYQTIDD